jgi:hypothetical protein
MRKGDDQGGKKGKCNFTHVEKVVQTSTMRVILKPGHLGDVRAKEEMNLIEDPAKETARKLQGENHLFEALLNEFSSRRCMQRGNCPIYVNS